ncbi:MAG: hypothetical protein KKH83_08660 [Candidatus Margulisbacteria bacterium]|nr:hypothetical protein [Candidatus Margulisiibacteriota bacterium]MBU1871136.1 hypothetical protein [Patescibacteria group bacterium]
MKVTNKNIGIVLRSPGRFVARIARGELAVDPVVNNQLGAVLTIDKLPEVSVSTLNAARTALGLDTIAIRQRLYQDVNTDKLAGEIQTTMQELSAQVDILGENWTELVSRMKSSVELKDLFEGEVEPEAMSALQECEVELANLNREAKALGRSVGVLAFNAAKVFEPQTNLINLGARSDFAAVSDIDELSAILGTVDSILELLNNIAINLGTLRAAVAEKVEVFEEKRGAASKAQNVQLDRVITALKNRDAALRPVMGDIASKLFEVEEAIKAEFEELAVDDDSVVDEQGLESEAGALVEELLQETPTEEKPVVPTSRPTPPPVPEASQPEIRVGIGFVNESGVIDPADFTRFAEAIVNLPEEDFTSDRFQNVVIAPLASASGFFNRERSFVMLGEEKFFAIEKLRGVREQGKKAVLQCLHDILASLAIDTQNFTGGQAVIKAYLERH